MEKYKFKTNKVQKVLMAILVLLVIIASILYGVKMMYADEVADNINTNNVLQNEETVQEPEPEPVKTVKTFAGNLRPIAVMIDNHIDAMPQAGLEQADLVYEIIVEGGETRLMLVLDQNKKLDRVGPIRSSRHYFLDYALENDAIYVHYGWSPQAKSDISSLGVPNINGIFYSTGSFWRDSSKYAPHNAVTNTANILKLAKDNGYRTTTNQEPVLNYVADEYEIEDGEVAKTVVIPYSDSNTAKYIYDDKTKEYTRYSRNKKQTDWNTDKTVTTKNIIIEFAENYSIDSYGRQTIENIKTLDGYYITNGKAIKITCQKKSRSGKTVYKDLNGNEINVNDGKTFIQICPLNSKVKISEE